MVEIPHNECFNVWTVLFAFVGFTQTFWELFKLGRKQYRTIGKLFGERNERQRSVGRASESTLRAGTVFSRRRVSSSRLRNIIFVHSCRFPDSESCRRRATRWSAARPAASLLWRPKNCKRSSSNRSSTCWWDSRRPLTGTRPRSFSKIR